jgi:hypothetical protein
MPLCPQITNTPITVTQTGDFTVTSVVPLIGDTQDGIATNISTTAAAAATAASEAATALSNAAAAQTTANAAAALSATSLQVSTNTIVNSNNQMTAINGNGITVYAGSSPTSGARVVLNSSGIAGFNSAGTSTFAVDATNGNVSVTGVINANSGYFGSPTNGWSISSTGLTGVGTGNITGGSIVASTFTSTGGVFSVSSAGFLTATSGVIGGWSISSTTLSKTSGTKTMTLNSSTAILSISDTSGDTLGGGGITITSSGVTGSYGARALTFGGTVAFSNDGSGNAFVQAGSNNTIRLSPNGGTYNNTYPVVVEGVLDVFSRLNVGGVVFFTGLSTSTAATNLRIGANGQILQVVPSSERFKENIVNLDTVFDLDPKKLLNLPVRAFTYKQEYLSENDDRFDVMIPGFIAEEVDSIYPIAADYDGDGPKSWNDRLMIPGLLALIQDLYKEIELLKGE